MPPAKAAIDDPDELIAEGIVTTVNPGGEANLSPMGPRVDRAFTRLVLRPYQTSTTYRNLKRTGEGVFHVTDDVELIAKAAISELAPLPELLPADKVRGFVIASACRWIAFRVQRIEDREERTTIECEVVASGELRPFFGFNRAKHAVLEAAILATRLGILPAEQIQEEMRRLAIPVQKTAGQQERRAFDFLREYVNRKLAQVSR